MTPATTATDRKVRSTLIDIGNCIGCRACQVACKQWNDSDGEDTEFEFDARIPEPGGAQREDLHADLVPRDVRQRQAGRRRELRLHDAALPALPGAGVRRGVPDDGALSGRIDGPVTYDADPLHRLPLLHLGLPVGRADRRLGLARAEDPQVHALRGSHAISRCPSRGTASR